MYTVNTTTANSNDFIIVQFQNSSFEQLNEKLAVVPVKFTKFNHENNDFHTKYLSPPYEKEDLQLIEEIVKNNSPAPDAWDLHKCVALRCFSKYLYCSSTLIIFSIVCVLI